jgi:hypothetical protein
LLQELREHDLLLWVESVGPRAWQADIRLTYDIDCRLATWNNPSKTLRRADPTTLQTIKRKLGEHRDLAW